MKKFSFKTWINKIQLVVLRFPFSIFFLLGLSFMFLLQINKYGIDIKPAKWVFFSLGIGLSVSVTLFAERFKSLGTKIGFQLLAIIVLLTYSWFLPDKFQAVNFYQVISIGIVLILSAFFIPFLKKNNDIPFWEFSKTAIIQLIISYLFSMILFAGLSLAVLSLKELFKIDIHEKIYQDIAVICFVLFGPVYFLANVTSKDEMYKPDFSFPKLLKILGLYILVPILALYSLILYVYLAQIIVKWELPNGWVSMLVSVLGLGGFLTMLILYPLRLETENKVVKLLSKYFPLLLLPLLILMSVGIFRRLDDYGMTINRLYVLILNIWLYCISLYLFISKVSHLKWIVISFTIVLFLSSAGPWSVFSITKRAMTNELEKQFSEANLLNKNKIIDNIDKKNHIKPELSESIVSKIEYLTSTYGNVTLQPYFKESILTLKSREIKDKLGLEYTVVRKNRENSQYFSINVENTNQKIELKSYSLFFNLKYSKDEESLYEDKNLKINLKDEIISIFKTGETRPFISIPFKSKLIYIIKTDNGNGAISSKEFEVNDDNYKLVVNAVSGNYFFKNDSIKIHNFSANLFLK